MAIGLHTLTTAYELVAASEDVGEEYERVLRRVYEAALRPGDVAFDIGAHVGKHSLPMAIAVMPAGKVVAVEPIDWAADRLRARVARSGLEQGLDVLHACCGSEPGSVEFHLVPDRPGLSSMKVRDSIAETVVSVVERLTADALAERYGDPRFIKIDVEGAEVDVLDGAQALIERSRPIIHLEVVPQALSAFDQTTGDIRDRLVPRGYILLDLLGNDVSDTDVWAEASELAPLADFIAVHRDDPAFADVERVLRAAFMHVRLNRDAWSSPWLRVAFPTTSDARLVSTSTDATVSVPVDLIRSPDLPAPWYWPNPTRHVQRHSIVVTPDGATWIDLNANRTTSLASPSTMPVPVRGFATEFEEGSSLEIDVSLDRQAGHTTTLVEFAWPSVDLVSVVRFHRDGRLEVLWFRGEERIALDRALLSTGSVRRIRLRHEPTRLVLNVRGAVGTFAEASVAVPAGLDQAPSFVIGRRDFGPSVDPVAVGQAEVAVRMVRSSSTTRPEQIALGTGRQLHRAERLAKRVVRKARRSRGS